MDEEHQNFKRGDVFIMNDNLKGFLEKNYKGNSELVVESYNKGSYTHILHVNCLVNLPLVENSQNKLFIRPSNYDNSNTNSGLSAAVKNWDITLEGDEMNKYTENTRLANNLKKVKDKIWSLMSEKKSRNNMTSKPNNLKIVLVSGPKGSGKSTLSQFMMNTILLKINEATASQSQPKAQKLYFFETDLGQPI